MEPKSKYFEPVFHGFIEPTNKWIQNTLCLKKNDTDVAHYNFDADQPILIIFGRDVAERLDLT